MNIELLKKIGMGICGTFIFYSFWAVLSALLFGLVSGIGDTVYHFVEGKSYYIDIEDCPE